MIIDINPFYSDFPIFSSHVSDPGSRMPWSWPSRRPPRRRMPRRCRREELGRFGRSCRKSDMGVPPVTIHFDVGFSGIFRDLMLDFHGFQWIFHDDFDLMLDLMLNFPWKPSWNQPVIVESPVALDSDPPTSYCFNHQKYQKWWLNGISMGI